MGIQPFCSNTMWVYMSSNLKACIVSSSCVSSWILKYILDIRQCVVPSKKLCFSWSWMLQTCGDCACPQIYMYFNWVLPWFIWTHSPPVIWVNIELVIVEFLGNRINSVLRKNVTSTRHFEILRYKDIKTSSDAGQCSTKTEMAAITANKRSFWKNEGVRANKRKTVKVRNRLNYPDTRSLYPCVRLCHGHITNNMMKHRKFPSGFLIPTPSKKRTYILTKVYTYHD